MNRSNTLMFVCSLSLLVVGCEGIDKDAIKNDDIKWRTKNDSRYREMNKAFGDESLSFGGKKSKEEVTVGIGVNSYLWRATLDTLSFMPLGSADPFGGVVMTEWHTDPKSSCEKFKVDVRILDRSLRADGLKISVFKKRRKGNDWIDEPVDQKTIESIENAILTRARQLKING
jgi:hypothetical protein